MTTTLSDLTAKKKPEPSAEGIAAVELVRLAKEQGLSLTGPDGLVKQSPRACSNTQRWASMRTARGSVQPVAMSVTSNVWQKSPPPRVPALMADQVDLDKPGLGVIPINPGADPQLTLAGLDHTIEYRHSACRRKRAPGRRSLARRRIPG